MLAAALLALALALTGDREDALLDAVRKGDVPAVQALLDQGVAVDTHFRYDRTPLSFAADRGNVALVKLLLERGADPASRDTFYKITPAAAAASKGHVEVVRLLLAKGVAVDDDVFLSAVRSGNADVVGLVLEKGTPRPEMLSASLESAEKEGAEAVAARLRAAGAVLPPRADFKADPAVLARYAGTYREEAAGGTTAVLSVAGSGLQGSLGGSPPRPLAAIDATTFRDPNAFGLVTLEVKMEGERVAGVTLSETGKKRWFKRVDGP